MKKQITYTLTAEEIEKVEKLVAFAISKKSPMSEEALRKLHTDSIIKEKKKLSKTDAKWEQRAKVEAISNDPNHSFDWFGHGTQAAYQRACLGSKFN